jgi:hypothetical protein
MFSKIRKRTTNNRHPDSTINAPILFPNITPANVKSEPSNDEQEQVEDASPTSNVSLELNDAPVQHLSEEAYNKALLADLLQF